MTSATATFGDFMQATSKKENNISFTWNGDYNYKSLGKNIDNMIMEMKQKLLNNPIQDSLSKIYSNGKKRKSSPGLPRDSTLNMPEYFRTMISTNFENIMKKIKTLPEGEQCFYLNMMFRSIFHERAIPRSGQGKGHKSIMFHLWHEMYKYMPDTCLELLHILPEYGCFRDLDNIMHHYINNNTITDSKVVNKCVDVYYSYLCNDFYTLFKIDMTTLSHSELRSNIEKFYREMKENKKNYPNISLVGKFIGREDKKFSFIREPLLSKIFTNGNYEKYNNSSKKFKNFTQVTLRYLLSILNKIIGTVETKMTAHKYNEIDPTKITSGASLKYRKYLMNQDQEGNIRSSDPQAIDLGKRTIQAAFNNKLNGSSLDSVKLANIIGGSLNVSPSEKMVINAQFNSLFENIKKNVEEEYERKMTIWVEEGSIPENKPLDPFNVIATIDVSGSMDAARVMNPAVLLGIIVTKLSKVGNTFLTFSEDPTLVTINPDDNIFDIFDSVKNSDWGGSTDIDKANRKLADMMSDYKKNNPDFSGQINHIIFTDGQFNQRFCTGWYEQPTSRESRYYYYDSNFNVVENTGVWNTAVERMEKYFTDYNLSMPNTVFWNMNANSPGFPTTGDMKGLQLAEGLSHGMLISILTNACEYTTDKNNVKKSNITPIESFRKTIYHPYFDKVTEVVNNTLEGVFSSKDNKRFSNEFTKMIINN